MEALRPPRADRETTVRRPRSLEAWLGRLTVAYERGLLVPFIGAGMSDDVCRLWNPFVAELERLAGLPAATRRDDPTHRAARAVRALRLAKGEELGDVVAKALLSRGPEGPPPQTTALADVFWPLVVTTNYDDLYVAAAHERHLESSRRRRRSGGEREVPLLLLGRSPDDCRRILASLRQPDVPILWALQGFVGGQARALTIQAEDEGARYSEYATIHEDHAHLERLRRELVVGHAEYRRVALASEPFRRAFAELYRSRSLLFLGSGLRDTYFLDLFSEIIELYGPSPHPHYAVVKPGSVDPDFLRLYFGIWVWETRHADLAPLLERLARRITGRRPRQLDWRFGGAHAGGRESHETGSELRVVRGPLPTEVAERERIVFSAGGTPGRPALSGVGAGYRDRSGTALAAALFVPVSTASHGEGGSFVWRHRDDRRFLAVNARLDPWTTRGGRDRPTDPTRRPFSDEKRTAGGRVRRDIRLVFLAFRELLSVAQQHDCDHVHAMLLAAGRLRTFPQSYALMQMVRGWAAWQASANGSLPDLSIYVTARDVLYDLDSGRLDLTRSLTPDVFEFWVEIEKQDGEPERYLEVAAADSSLRDVLRRFDIERGGWKLDLWPRPSLDWGNWSVSGIEKWERAFPDDVLTVERFGILPGSTLRLEEPGSRLRRRRGRS
jgi:hypothetical protein